MLNLPRRRNEPVSSPFKRFGLTDLPFPTEPLLDPYSRDPRRNGSIYAQSPVRDAIEKFERLLIRPGDFPNRAKIASLWAAGDRESGRGMGKSALLRFFQQRINTDWGLTQFDGQFYACAIYVAFPEQVDRRWMEQLAWAALVDVCQNGVLDVARAALRREMITDDKVQDVVSVNDGVDWRRLLDDSVLADHGISVSDVDDKVDEQLLANGVEHGPASALVSGAFEDYLRSLRRDRNLRPYYIPRDTRGLDYSRTLFFNDIVLYLRSAGFAGGYLFVDDIENLTDQMARRHRTEFVKEFRLCTVNPGYANTEYGFFSSVLTTHQQSVQGIAQAWTEAGLSTMAPLDPHAPTSVELPLPTPDQAQAIIIAHLDYYRANPDDSGTIRPFTEDGLQALIGRARHPRTMLSNAAYVMMYAVDGETAVIDANAVEEALSGALRPSSAPSYTDYTEGMEGIT